MAGVYVGFDDPAMSLGPSETGARAAAPIWKGFMDVVQGSLPIETFEQPSTVVAHRVNRNGQLLGPCDPADQSRLEFFKVSTIPERLLSSNGCGRTALPRFKPANGARQAREDDNL